jgi:hypothetical protein
MHVLPYAAAPAPARAQWALTIVLGALAGWYAAVPLYQWALEFVTSGSAVSVSNPGDPFFSWVVFTVPAVATGVLLAACSLALARLFRWPVTAVYRVALYGAALLLVYASAAYVPLLGERRSIAALTAGSAPGTVTVPIESIKLWPALLAGAGAVLAAMLIVLTLQRLARGAEVNC